MSGDSNSIFQDTNANNISLEKSLNDANMTDIRRSRFENEGNEELIWVNGLLFYFYVAISFLVLGTVTVGNKLSFSMTFVLVVFITLYPLLIDMIVLSMYKLFGWIFANIMGYVYL